MNDLISKIINGEELDYIVRNVLQNIYVNGPSNITDMEILCYLCTYQKEKFATIQNRLLKYMGLHYKDIKSEDLVEVVFGMYDQHIKENYKYSYTPVQASIVDGIDENKCFSFSAPTSTGKSYVFRNIIMEADKDIVIVVPSRALINEYYYSLCNLVDDRGVNILTFIDKINTKKARRNVFIVTPERCKEIFKHKDEFDVEIFLFDEAQLSNEESTRGLYFDSIVRRIQKAFPKAKFIFSHPFVKNPIAQIEKNHFDVENSRAMCYEYKNVGQMFYAYENESYYHFGINKEIMGERKYRCNYDPVQRVLDNNGSILIYTNKSSIYNKSVFTAFKKYIDSCVEISDKEAKKYIKQIKKYIGANDKRGTERYSQMLYLLNRGVVIHHGSLPLQARLLLERFTQSGYCRICFATSTLEQGVNMPFDLVFLNTFEASKPLALKNLIGRAGRSSLEKKFDYGSIVIHKRNMSQFRRIMCEDEELSTVSLLEEDVDLDMKDFKEAVLNGTLSDEYNITQKQLNTLKNIQSKDIVKKILDNMFPNGQFIQLTDINSDQQFKLELYANFRKLYEQYLGRELMAGEKNVFNTAIMIMIWQLHCKTFKDICFYRYAFASKLQEREKIQKAIQEGNELEKFLGEMKLKHLMAAFVTECKDIPNKNINVYSMFGNNTTKAQDVDYDRIVFDTYDYLDKIIGFRLSDIFVAAFKEYFIESGDSRAERMVCLIKYGTDREKEIWMLRYGFSFEDIEWLDEYIEHISQEEIIFNRNIRKLPIEKYEVIKRFL